MKWWDELVNDEYHRSVIRQKSQIRFLSGNGFSYSSLFLPIGDGLVNDQWRLLFQGLQVSGWLLFNVNSAISQL
jgi:hypothetical protein